MINKKRLKRIVKEELLREAGTIGDQWKRDIAVDQTRRGFKPSPTGTPASANARSEFDQILLDPDISMGDKGWLRMLGKMAGEKMAIKVFRKQQEEQK